VEAKPVQPSPAAAPVAERAGTDQPKVASKGAPVAKPERPAAAVPPAAVVEAKPSGGGEGAAAPAEPDLLETRLAATEQWLAREALGTFSIQLLGTNDPEQLKDHLNALSKFVEINKVFVYRTKAKQKPSITVLYGSFTSPREAREALDKLPQSLRANQPILRTVQGIRAEIKQHQTTS
jgi:septal ring-binding cell division protein DamX